MSDIPIISTNELKVDTTQPKFSIIAKLLSGRLWLTLVAGICFWKITGTVCNVILAKSDQITVSEIIAVLTTIVLIVQNIVTFYFVKNNVGNNGNGK